MGWITRWRDTLRQPVSALALALIMTVGAGCTAQTDSPDERLAPPPSPEGDPLDVSGADLWLSFDDPRVGFDGKPEYADAQGGPFAGRVMTANGGSASAVDGAPGRGKALAFPGRCSSGTGCPRAMVEVPADVALEPGERPFTYGASVRLARDQTAVGSNIVQSGRFGSEGGQWKLQVDGEAGRPSCIIRSGEVDARVRSSLTIADDAWHRVVCRRDAEGVSIEVDGEVDRRSVSIGSVDTGLPVRIGSPGMGDDDDQFHGIVDDVVLDIDPRQ